MQFEESREPNFEADEGVVSVTQGGSAVAVLKPQKRIYRVQQMPMTEAAIDAGLFRDLFFALGEPLGGPRSLERASLL